MNGTTMFSDFLVKTYILFCSFDKLKCGSIPPLYNV